MKNGEFRLPEADLQQVLHEQTNEQLGFAYLCIQDSTGTVISGSWPDGMPSEYAARLQETQDCLTYLDHLDTKTYLTVGSAIELEGDRYLLLTGVDVSDLYGRYRTQVYQGLLLVAVFSLGIALVLLVCCRLLLRPLNRVNHALQELADGAYDNRLPETGGEEFRVLAHNLNAMADATAEKTRLLQETADSRKHFVDSMAHEMKTPLTSILCLGDLLRIRRSVTDQERQEYAGVIVEEAQRMKALSSKLLTLATADSSAPDFRDSSLVNLLETVQHAMQPILEQRGVRLTLAGEDIRLTVDRQLFQTLLINLIDNASKASEAGQQVLVCYTARKGMLILAVIDEGIGMSKEELRRATEAFWMADKSRSRKAGGAGLGLALCEEIVKLHGATMQMTSEPGKGTTVQLTVPLRQSQTGKREERK